MTGRVVTCDLCPKACAIPDGAAGDCRVRVNLGGKLLATTWGRPSAIHVDPMEKKPLFHFLPGEPVLSIATAGCNLHCKNCQNWQLSQRGGEQMEEVFRAPPEDVVDLAVERGCRAVAYTYTEPLVFYEYVLDTSTAARRRSLRNVIVSAGFVNRAPLVRLCRVLDAAKIDLKSFDESFYRDHCDASLRPVLNSLVTLREQGVWLEIAVLIVPTLSDDLRMLRRMARWIHDELGASTPVHYSRFQPEYRLRNLPPTSGETLLAARAEAMDVGLEYVYTGNLFGDPSESTRCPHDGTMLIRRSGYVVEENRLVNGRCPTCSRQIPGVWGGAS